MKITNILPALFITKENNFSGVDLYITQGDKIRVIDFEGNLILGKFLFVEWGYYEEEDDIIKIELNDGSIREIGMSSVEDIDDLD